jgi:putative CocE/NonD family hydrolase
MPDMQAGYVRWFDHWLKGIDNGVQADPAVRYFTMGQNEWREADAWPPKESKRVSWYLSRASNSSAQRAGVLVRARPSGGNEEPDQYSADPARPAPDLVDIRTNQLSIPQDYQEVERRTDSLTYTTETFTRPFEVTGDSVAVLYAASNQRDTDWVVRITDVFPDGRSINIIVGYARARFRNGMSTETLLKPGEIVRYEIPFTWTSYQFAAGHRMRLAVASAAAGSYAVNANSGNPTANDVDLHIANQRIFHSSRYPSHVELSVPSSIH